MINGTIHKVPHISFLSMNWQNLIKLMTQISLCVLYSTLLLVPVYRTFFFLRKKNSYITQSGNQQKKISQFINMIDDVINPQWKLDALGFHPNVIQACAKLSSARTPSASAHLASLCVQIGSLWFYSATTKTKGRHRSNWSFRFEAEPYSNAESRNFRVQQDFLTSQESYSPIQFNRKTTKG